MLTLYVFETERVWGLTEGEHSAPVLTATTKTVDPYQIEGCLETSIYYYRAAQGQIAGPGLFGKLPEVFWPDAATPQFVLLTADLDLDYL